MPMIKHAVKQKQSVIVPKNEYARLKQQAKAYRILVSKVFEMNLRDPVGDIVTDFKDTGLYTNAFLKDFEIGLRKSSYTKHYVHQALKKGS